MNIKVIKEVVDDEGGLIGSEDMPQTGSNLMSVSKRTSDYNMSTGHQKMGDHVLGYFGAVMMPFFEGEGNDESDNKTMVVNAVFDLYIAILEHYYKNPNKLKNDYRIYSKDNSVSKDITGFIVNFLKEIKETIKEKEQSVDESVVVEDKMYDNKNTEEFSPRSTSKDISPKNLGKVADLINKMDNDAKLALKKLIETT